VPKITQSTIKLEYLLQITVIEIGATTVQDLLTQIPVSQDIITLITMLLISLGTGLGQYVSQVHKGEIKHTRLGAINAGISAITGVIGILICANYADSQGWVEQHDIDPLLFFLSWAIGPYGTSLTLIAREKVMKRIKTV